MEGAPSGFSRSGNRRRVRCAVVPIHTQRINRYQYPRSVRLERYGFGPDFGSSRRMLCTRPPRHQIGSDEPVAMGLMDERQLLWVTNPLLTKEGKLHRKVQLGWSLTRHVSV